MTNEQIIFNERVRLMKEGIIKSTGRTLEFTDPTGETIQIDEPEQIHSFSYWKEHENRVPKKGSKAIASFPVWCKSKGKGEEVDEGEEEQGKMFLKNTFFFVYEQTEKIK